MLLCFMKKYVEEICVVSDPYFFLHSFQTCECLGRSERDFRLHTILGNFSYNIPKCFHSGAYPNNHHELWACTAAHPLLHTQLSILPPHLRLGSWEEVHSSPQTTEKTAPNIKCALSGSHWSTTYEKSSLKPSHQLNLQESETAPK